MYRLKLREISEKADFPSLRQSWERGEEFVNVFFVDTVMVDALCYYKVLHKAVGRSRGVCRTQLNIFDGAFFRK